MFNKLQKFLYIFGIVALVIIIVLFWLYYAPAKELSVSFLDVGQGDAILIQSPFGQNILIDGGPDDKVIAELSKELAWHDRTIDLMILTHPHDDHVNGLNFILDRFAVNKILYTGVSHTAPGYIDWLEKIKAKKIPLLIVDRPQSINLGENCRLEIIYPFTSFLGKATDNLNNTSIVAKLIYQDTVILLTGDIEEEAEKEIIQKNTNISAQVMKAAHHGSNTSNTEDFLKAVKPNSVVISAGKDNQFNHPSRRVIKRLERSGVEIYRTDNDGTIKFVSNGKQIDKK